MVEAPKASLKMRSMRRRFSVLKRSRGTNTRQDRKRPKASRRTNPGRQLLEAARALTAAGLAQDPEPRASDPGQPQVAVAVLELVLPVAEEREVVVLEPAQKRLRLGDLLGIERRRARVEL